MIKGHRLNHHTQAEPGSLVGIKKTRPTSFPMLAGSVAGNLAFHSYFRIGMNRSILSVTFKQRPQVFPTVERFSPTVCLPTGDSRGLIGCLHLSLLYDCPQDSACYQRLPLWMVYQQLNLLTPTIYPNTPACFTCSGFHVVSRDFYLPRLNITINRRHGCSAQAEGSLAKGTASSLNLSRDASRIVTLIHQRLKDHSLSCVLFFFKVVYAGLLFLRCISTTRVYLTQPSSLRCPLLSFELSSPLDVN